MRIRHNPKAYPTLCESELFVRLPIERKGNWRNSFQNPTAPFYVELGCGKGGFASRFAYDNRECNLLAVDIKSEMLFKALQKTKALFAESNEACSNLLITSHDIERINLILGENDVCDGIYINFCNPWVKKSHQKKRLTHTRQLLQYRQFLKTGGKITFKTDDQPLFEDSLLYFNEAGYEITLVSRDIYQDGLADKYIPTEHEAMFREQNKQIFLIEAIKNDA